MRLESTVFDREYAREAINVTLMDLVLIRDPHKKIKNMVFRWRLFMAIQLPFTALTLYDLVKYGGLFFAVCFGVMIVVMVVIALYLIWAERGMKEFSDPGRHVVWTFDEEGIRYCLNGSMEIRFFWENFQCLRIGRAGIFFIPKDRGKGNILGMPAEHKDAVIRYLEETGRDIRPVHENP